VPLYPSFGLRLGLEAAHVRGGSVRDGDLDREAAVSLSDETVRRFGVWAP
jgi:hypothetical protein